jgi:hypothetical protein
MLLVEMPKAAATLAESLAASLKSHLEIVIGKGLRMASFGL